MSVPVATIEEVRAAVAQARNANLSIGFVPTMGALHDGHASLIRAARLETGFVVVSIFVNPTQFVAGEDFERYPRPVQQDTEMCKQERVDLVFAPSTEAMYTHASRTSVEVSELGDGLCGPSRPGHFRGVATIVLKLFEIVRPDVAYFGQKDYQQARIVQQLIADLNVPVRMRICPIVRDSDGLALSSRNKYLNHEQRIQASVLWHALQEARDLVSKGHRDPATLQRVMATRISSTPGAVLDYAAVVDADSLRPIKRWQGAVLLAVAARFGSTRLIDNILISAAE